MRKWSEIGLRETLEPMSGRGRGYRLLGGEETPGQTASRLLRDETVAGLIREIESEADRMLGEPAPELTDEMFRAFRETGERLSYEKVYFERRKRLNAFAMMTWLKPEADAYCDALHETAWSICGEFTWCLPAHYGETRGPYGNIDLFAAETGFALAEIAALLEHSIDVRLQERIRAETERRLFQPFLEQGPYPWEKLENNWSSVCAGSIGSAALYAIEDPERLAAVLERVHASMDCFLAGYGEDGACVEGYSYWQYGFGYYVYYADLLKRMTHGGIDGFAIPKVKEIALFQQRCFSCGDAIINFSDSPQQSGIFMGLTMRLREEYPEVALPNAAWREPYAADHCGRWAPAIRNLLWAAVKPGTERPQAIAAAADWPAEAHYMPDAEWFMSRHASRHGAVYCFAAKGGHNGESHNHNDCGHFILHADGETYVADLGRGLYSKQYFGPERYSFWCNGSQGHSVPVAGGLLQEEGEHRKAAVLEASIGESEDRFALELSGAYPESAGLLGLQRSFVWSKGEAPGLTLSDRFLFGDEPGSARIDETIERFITLIEPRLLKDGAIGISGERHTLRIAYDPSFWQPEITKRLDRDHFGQERRWYTLDFRLLPGVRRSGEFEASFAFAFAGQGK
ncbi:hypothetical protein D3P08_19240 [Paenibacillus nanensis]|uniref:Heparinase II/III-like C-terminal domain-containing protein n=1 Tax=Paenibacillus nanensis TaxID=393251 RepID=A0A3A1UWY3_9BACL|nr:heparinase II/III family protein [Paenibacillus nanensis]RIX50833.1 hypothetical protein D3P08_19240 [Paenibacillus nanensis]